MRSLTRTLPLLLVCSPLPLHAVEFKKDIAPIFSDYCYSCHGEDDGSGKLRLHNAEAITESLKVHDDLLVAGKPEESELYERLILPEDSSKLMPQGGPPLEKEEIEIIKKWIEEGARYEVTADAPADETMPDQAEPTGPQPAPIPERPPVPQASPDDIAAAEKAGALVINLFSGSHELRASFPSSRDQVTDETVAKLVPLAPQLVELDVSGTAITDEVAASLAELRNLETLHLERTAIGDSTVAALVDMPYLQYLNLHSTQITDESLETLKSVPTLRKLYLWQAPVSYEAAKALEKATPGLTVNLGWDHPGVVRERLTSELSRAETQQSEAQAAIEEHKQKLSEAEAQKKSAEEQITKAKQELEALDKPADAPADEANENGASDEGEKASEGDKPVDDAEDQAEAE